MMQLIYRFPDPQNSLGNIWKLGGLIWKIKANSNLGKPLFTVAPFPLRILNTVSLSSVEVEVGSFQT